VGHRTRTFDEPEEPDAPETEEKKSTEAPVNELELRLLKGRKVMVFGQINDKLARGVVARILTLAEESTKPIERVRKDTERNYWMSASEAIDYGLATKIISSIGELR